MESRGVEKIQELEGHLWGCNDQLALLTGRFLIAHGKVEFQLKRILAHVIDLRDFDRFELLVDRVPTPRLIASLQSAGKVYMKMGPNLTCRLKIFSEKAAGLRNGIAHGLVTDDKSDLVISTLAKYLEGEPQDVRPLGQAPLRISFATVAERSARLQNLAYDLTGVAYKTWKPEGYENPLEIDNPRSAAQLV